MALDRLDFVPAGDPWQKSDRPVTNAGDRAEMVSRAISGNPEFGLSRVEIERKGPSYSVDTVAEVARGLTAGDELFYLVGADAAAGIETWQDTERLLKLCTLVVIGRPGVTKPSSGGDGERRIILKASPRIEISSTGIRERVRAGRSIRYLVPPAVEAFIAERGLYK